MRAISIGGCTALRRGRGWPATVAALASALSLVCATAGLAQPRGPRPATTRPAPSALAAGTSATAAAPLTASSADAGAVSPVPVPPAFMADDGGRLSPLNPAANEFSDAGPPVPSVDYDRLLADLASLRARASAVSDVLFHSRLAISLQTSGDHGRIAGVSVAVDDGTVWTAPLAFRAEDATTVFDHAVAPGRHAVTVDVDRTDDRDESFRSSQRSRFAVDVPADARLSVDIGLGDESSMGGDFPKGRKGEYDLRVRVHAKAQALAQGQ